jgi:glycosyltransferase involved in cell wall biosynthesis
MNVPEGASGGRGSGPVVVDLRVLQSPHSRTARPAGLALELATALEEHFPDLVGRYLLAPDWPPPGDITDLLGTGKVAHVGSPGAVQAEARVYLSLFCCDMVLEPAKLWPPVVESEGLLFCAVVNGLALGTGPTAADEDDDAAGEGMSAADRWRVRAGTWEALRHADAVLATSEQALVGLRAIGIDPARVTFVGAGPRESTYRAVPPAGSDPAAHPGRAVPPMQEPPWSTVAEVLERLGRRPRRPWRRPLRARRLALISPFPPVPSGVAGYAARLAPALQAELRLRDARAELDCFADGRDRAPAAPEVAGAWYDARNFGCVAAALAGYDEVVYALGNSEFHAGALAALRHCGRGGTVMAHDVRMTNLFRYSGHALGPETDGLSGAIHASYGSCLPQQLGQNNQVSAADEETYGLLLLRQIAVYASRVLVHSPAARRLAEVDVGPALSSRLGVLPFALALPPADLTTVRAAGAGRHREAPLRIASFGIVDPIKQLDVVVRAFAEMRQARRHLELFIVGPASDSISAHLANLAADLGAGEHFHLTGAVSREEYLGHLGRADLAVQLRARDGGEASGAVGDCLAAGIPTVVSHLGWLAELPEEVVVKIRRQIGHVELAGVLGALLDDEQERSRLSVGAAAWAAHQTIEQTARALLDAIGIG